ncbi:MAG: hypothetical protein F6K54_06745 [Okeania sp. SIO3B5]|nr:hypothetical protein [Okeania sp. SIO3B5]
MNGEALYLNFSVIAIADHRIIVEEGRRSNCLWIVFDRPLRVLITPNN